MTWDALLPVFSDPRNYLVVTSCAMVLWGYLVPRKIVDDIRSDRDMYKAAFETSEESRRQQGEQLGALLEHARTTDAFIRSLQVAARKVDQ